MSSVRLFSGLAAFLTVNQLVVGTIPIGAI